MKIRQLGKYLVILFIILILSNLFIFLLGNIVKLHPNAYFDLSRSIIIVYSIYILIILITPVVKSILEKRKININILESHGIKMKCDSPIIWIGLCFSLLTIVNSLMMIFGYDTPKQGIFAYVHMMIRLTIISMSVSLCTIKEWREIIKNKNILKNYKNEFLKSTNVQYVSIVSVYCISNIIFSPIYYIPSGVNFYKILVGIYITLCIITLIRKIFSRLKAKNVI